MDGASAPRSKGDGTQLHAGRGTGSGEDSQDAAVEWRGCSERRFDSLMFVRMSSPRSLRTECSCNFQSDSRPRSIPIQGSNVRTWEDSAAVST